MRKKPQNRFKCAFPAKSVNEGFARYITAAFVSQLDLRVSDVSDLKTAVSEAVTNAVVHGYRESGDPRDNMVFLSGDYFADGKIIITIKDKGCGIENVAQAMEPLYTTAAEEERSGMGFTIMETLTDEMRVVSKPGKGTTVRLIKKVKM